jgi:catechol 2,3-dioxygenase-like lactoylglutathione lyase family enzyme
MHIKGSLFGMLISMVLVPEVLTQEIDRPAIWGIAKMTFLVSDFQVARSYYGQFLGFIEAFSYPSEHGQIIAFKVNDRQFLEFIEDRDARNKNRLVSVSFETDDAEQMRQFLKSKEVEVPETTTVDGAGNESILVRDPSGIPVEFIQLKPHSLHRHSTGRFLSENRISHRIHHAGLYCDQVRDDDPFYVGILGFKELWRYPEDHNLPVQMNYLQIPDCVENIEHYPSDDPNFSHPCFLVEDMQETLYTLKERRSNQELAAPVVGRGKRWLLNLKNEDGTRVEFTEAHTVR